MTTCDVRAALCCLDDALHAMQSELCRLQRRNSECMAQLRSSSCCSLATAPSHSGSNDSPHDDACHRVTTAAQRRASAYRVGAAVAHTRLQLAQLWQRHVVDGWYAAQVTHTFVPRVQAQLRQLHARLQRATHRLRGRYALPPARTPIRSYNNNNNNDDDDDDMTRPRAVPPARVFLKYYAQQLQHDDMAATTTTTTMTAADEDAVANASATTAVRPMRTLTHVLSLLLRVLPDATASARDAQRTAAMTRLAATTALCVAVQQQQQQQQQQEDEEERHREGDDDVVQ